MYPFCALAPTPGHDLKYHTPTAAWAEEDLPQHLAWCPTERVRPAALEPGRHGSQQRMISPTCMAVQTNKTTALAYADSRETRARSQAHSRTRCRARGCVCLRAYLAV